MIEWYIEWLRIIQSVPKEIHHVHIGCYCHNSVSFPVCYNYFRVYFQIAFYWWMDFIRRLTFFLPDIEFIVRFYWFFIQTPFMGYLLCISIFKFMQLQFFNLWHVPFKEHWGVIGQISPISQNLLISNTIS